MFIYAPFCKAACIDILHSFPLARHLSNLETDIQPPEYVKEDPVYDLSMIFDDAPEKEKLREVNILEDFPFDIKSSMDRSQKEALHRMLTSSVAIVQGPPGTGKTFTSVIVRLTPVLDETF
jgi:helicase required for RNAi-mediated heterochromatin assembly 1